MAHARLKVFQEWQRHFEAPAALMRLSSRSSDVLAADEDGSLHLIDRSNTLLLSKQLPWMPAALAIDAEGDRLAAISAAGTVLVLDRSGATSLEARIAWKPASIDIAADGGRIVFADGAGKIGFFDMATRRVTYSEAAGPYHYVRFLPAANDLLALGLYGQTLFAGGGEEGYWQKDYRCNTRCPAASARGEIILLPSPHYGVIGLRRDGKEIGLFEVPEGPRAVAVSADGQRIFVLNEKNVLFIFEPNGTIRFRQPLSSGVAQLECDADGEALTALLTSGSVERFRIGMPAPGESRYLEFPEAPAETGPAGPVVLWQNKVFSAFTGAKGGQVALTRGARHVALLDYESRLRVFDHAGTQSMPDDRVKGRQPTLKASRSEDFLIAATSDALLAMDLRAYRQKRVVLKNEWATHFDIAPTGVFFAVADFFQGMSLYDESLKRVEFLETEAEVLDVAVDGQRHTMAVLANGVLAVYDEKGRRAARIEYPTEGYKAIVGLENGFVAAGEGRADAFRTDGTHAWTAEVPGEPAALTPTRAGLVISTTEGNSYVANGFGTLVRKLARRSAGRFAAGAREGEVVSIEHHERLLTARSSETGVLWRREMDDDILALEVSPDGGFAAVLAGVTLYVLATASGDETPKERLYLEI